MVPIFADILYYPLLKKVEQNPPLSTFGKGGAKSVIKIVCHIFHNFVRKGDATHGALVIRFAFGSTFSKGGLD
jgi:hypothetical protein